MRAAASFTRVHRRWGQALRDQNADAVVRCDACGLTAAVEVPTGAKNQHDREHWPELPCLFTPGCRGAIGPEPLN